MFSSPEICRVFHELQPGEDFWLAGYLRNCWIAEMEQRRFMERRDLMGKGLGNGSVESGTRLSGILRKGNGGVYQGQGGTIQNGRYGYHGVQRAGNDGGGANSSVANSDLLVFGYACKLYRDDLKAQEIDQGKHLIPWMDDANLKIDR